MYKVLVDGNVFCDSRIDDLAIISPAVTLEANAAGSFVFTIPPTHPQYDVIKRRKSVISVYRDNDIEPIFQGICTKMSDDFFKQKKIICEGELSYLNDSIQRPARYQGVTVLELLKTYILNHNEQVEEHKRFEIGTVTVTDQNNYISCYTNMQSTMTEIKEDLVDDLGGFLRVRHENGKKLIDYLADSPQVNSQAIELGVNLLDYESNIDTTEIATQIIPLGARLETSSIEGLEEYLTIKSVNNNVDYVMNKAAVDANGIVTKVVKWDEVTTPEALKSKAEKYLSDYQFDNIEITVKAIDLGNLSNKIEKFQLLDSIRVISEPHGMDKYFMLTKITLNLNNPENDVYTLGKTEKLSLTAKTNTAIAEAVKQIIPASSITKQAVEQATSMITGVKGGYVILDIDEETKVPYRILIMDKPEKDKATNVIQINQNGIGFSTSGIAGPYRNAWTIDGNLIADFITTGTMYADRIKGGTLTVGGSNNKNGQVIVKDANGNTVVSLDVSGITTNSAHITGGIVDINTESDNANIIQLTGPKNKTIIRPGNVWTNGSSYAAGNISTDTAFTCDGTIGVTATINNPSSITVKGGIITSFS